jgi:hypothetical protein
MSDRNQPREAGEAWPGDGTPRGGTGTLTRQAAPAAEPRQRRARPVVTPGVAPRTTRRPPATVRPPVPGRVVDRGRERVAARASHVRAAQVRAAQARAAHRMPFFVLLCGLLAGALISALLISTTLAEGSFQITRLQQSDNALARQRQQLQEQVAAAQSAQVIGERAYQLGMRPDGELRFLNLKTGKIVTDAGSGAVSGYTP